jgi:hypothetical protein
MQEDTSLKWEDCVQSKVTHSLPSLFSYNLSLNKMKSILISLWILVILLLEQGTEAALTSEQKKALLDGATKADKSIHHIPVQQLENRIQKGQWLIFFGAHWCKITQRLVFIYRICIYFERNHRPTPLIQTDAQVARGPRKSEIRPKISINSVDKSRMWG